MLEKLWMSFVTVYDPIPWVWKLSVFNFRNALCSTLHSFVRSRRATFRNIRTANIANICECLKGACTVRWLEIGAISFYFGWRSIRPIISRTFFSRVLKSERDFRKFTFPTRGEKRKCRKCWKEFSGIVRTKTWTTLKNTCSFGSEY